MLRTGGQSTTLVNGGRKKVHTTFDDGSELVRAPLSTRTLHRAASSPRLPDVRHTAAPQRNATQPAGCDGGRVSTRQTALTSAAFAAHAPIPSHPIELRALVRRVMHGACR